MFGKIAKFKMNGWVVIAIAAVTVAAVNSGLAYSKQARQDAARLITSIPVMDSATPKAVEVDKETGAQRYGGTILESWTDEITGNVSWVLSVRDKTDSTAGVGVLWNNNDPRPFPAIVFPSNLYEFNDGKTIIEGRFTLRNGTAVTRKYVADNEPGSSSAVLRSETFAEDFVSLIGKSSYVAFRSLAASGEATLVRVNVDAVDWAASAKAKKIIPSDSKGIL